MLPTALLLSALSLTIHAQLQFPMADCADITSAPLDDIILSDILGTQRQINVFSSFTKDIDSVASLLDCPSQNSTVLAPLNTAISSLPRKPWEDPRDYGALGASAYEGKDGEDRAHRNLRRFTEAHVVTVSPWEEGERVQNLLGLTMWWERREGKTFIMPGSVEVEGIVGRVKNGEVWVLKGVVNYAS